MEQEGEFKPSDFTQVGLGPSIFTSDRRNHDKQHKQQPTTTAATPMMR